MLGSITKLWSRSDNSSGGGEPAGKIHHGKDKYAKALLGAPHRFAAFLALFCLEPMRKLLGGMLPELQSSEFISELLRGSYADLLYKVWTNREDPPFFFTLVEIKSFTDPHAFLQILRYMVSAWIAWVNGEAEKSRNLPPFYVVLLYTGNKRWNEPLTLAKASPWMWLLGKLVPQFNIHLVDLSALPDETLLKTNGGLSAGLLALKYADRENLDVKPILTIILKQLTEEETKWRVTTIVFILDTFPYLTHSELTELYCSVNAETGRDDMQYASDIIRAEGRTQGWDEGWDEGRTQGWDEGRTQGWDEGRTQGRDEGMALALMRVLETRFGVLPEEVRQRIQTADASRVDRWIVESPSAPTLDKLINGHDDND